MKTIYLIIAVMMLSGCAQPSSYYSRELDQAALNTLSNDMAGTIAAHNPASTLFSLEKDQFSPLLAEALKKKGFAVTVGVNQTASQDSKKIIYIIDWLSPENLYSSATVGDERYTRAYQVAAGKVKSSSGSIIGVSHE